MITSDFIKQCARSYKDPDLAVIDSEEWKDIINQSVPDLYPDIYETSTTAYACSSLDDNTYQIDLSGMTDLVTVKQVLIQDANDRWDDYQNWIFHSDTKLLDLRPEFWKTHTDYIGDVNVESDTNEVDPLTYENLKIVYKEFTPLVEGDDDVIDLNRSQLSLLKKQCLVEALRRTLNDSTKKDKYRTQLGQINEYALIAIIRDYQAEIEAKLNKRQDKRIIRYY